MNKRTRWDMPQDIWQIILNNNLKEEFDARPPYQRNDYVGWINQAKQDKTRNKRINQMIAELREGDVYMNMPWGSSTKNTINKTSKTIEEYIDSSGKLFSELITKLDKCLISINPKYETKQAWGGWAYKSEKNYSCLLVRYKDHVKLMIMRGKMLDDSKNLLQGSGTNTRHLRFKSSEDIDCEYLQKLLTQQKRIFDSGIKWEG